MKASQIFHLGIFLAILCAVASGILVVTNKLTAENIEKMKLKKTSESLKIVLGNFDNNPVESAKKISDGGSDATFFPAIKDGKLTGFAVESYSRKGYGGKITVMFQIDLSGKIGTVIVTEKNETPGLGTAATDRVRVKTISEVFSGKKDESIPPNKVLDSFKGLDSSTAPWKLKRNNGVIDGITGATISSLAVTDAVNIGVEIFNRNKTELLAEFSKNTLGE
jgi:electron transport complex protein RnfG